MEKIIHIEDSLSLRDIFGVEDANSKLLQKEFKVAVFSEPEGIVVKGPKNKVAQAEKVIKKIMDLAKEGFIFSKDELKSYVKSASGTDEAEQISVLSRRAQKDSMTEKFGFSRSTKESGSHMFEDGRIRISSVRKKYIVSRTKGQREYLYAMHNYDIVFSIGPAGTGKTYIAMATAVNYLMEKKVSRIILARPAIEAGESLGFLPGDMQAKLGPYLRPLYDALYDMMDAHVIEEHLETGIIEVAPLAYMRGRTLNNAFVILDEAQNCTSEQLKMFLTRLGFDSKTVITGDITQSDLPGGKPLGLLDAVNILRPIKGIKFVKLTNQDVVRHPLIQNIIQAYEDFGKEK